MRPLVGRVIQRKILCFSLFFQAQDGGGEESGGLVEAFVGAQQVGVDTVGAVVHDGLGGDHWWYLADVVIFLLLHTRR